MTALQTERIHYTEITINKAFPLDGAAEWLRGILMKTQRHGSILNLYAAADQPQRSQTTPQLWDQKPLCIEFWHNKERRWIIPFLTSNKGEQTKKQPWLFSFAFWGFLGCCQNQGLGLWIEEFSRLLLSLSLALSIRQILRMCQSFHLPVKF